MFNVQINTQVALEEINDLPEFMHACTMSYVPQVGYMLVVDPWDGNETITEETEAIQGLPDLDFLFCVGGVPHFKTRRLVGRIHKFQNVELRSSINNALQVPRARRGDWRHGD